MKSQMSFSKKDVAVTLVCVVFLLATLGAVGSGGRQRAKDAVCLSNLRQWGCVFARYADDNDGHFMHGWMGLGLTNPSDLWPEALRSYYHDNGDFRLCPVATRPASERQAGWIWPAEECEAWGVFPDSVTTWGAKPGHYGSYGINAWVCNPLEGAYYAYIGFENVYWRGPNVRGASNVPLFSDCVWMEAWPVATEEPLPSYELVYISRGNSMGRLCVKRHGTNINMLFLDFSVRKVGLKELWTLKWHRGYRPELAPVAFPNWMTVP